MGGPGGFEKAVFTDAKKADFRSRWVLLLFLLLLLAVFYWILRDIVYRRLVHDYAQRLFNGLYSASIEKLGSVEIDRQGDVLLHDAEAWTFHRGVRRLYFRARTVRLALDGTPLRDRDLRVMRVDLYRPEIFVRREHDAEWNVEWAMQRAPQAEATPTAEEAPLRADPWKDYRAVDEAFPRNGVHIHDGILHVTFASKSGREVDWRITGVRTRLTRTDGVLSVRPFSGDFYGGRIEGHAELPQTTPLTVRQLTADIRDADVSLMARDAPFVKYAVTGRFNAVFALTVDPDKTRRRPIIAGHCEITDGDLWELPSFATIIHVLALSPVSEKRIDSAVLEFTVEQDRIKVDQMHFLGYPVSLFGDGECSLTGDWIRIDFVPRLGKGDMDSILRVILKPIDLLTQIFTGLFVRVALRGSFDNPRFEVGQAEEPDPKIRKLIEEKAPR